MTESQSGQSVAERTRRIAAEIERKAKEGFDPNELLAFAVVTLQVVADDAEGLRECTRGRHRLDSDDPYRPRTCLVCGRFWGEIDR